MQCVPKRHHCHVCDNSRNKAAPSTTTIWMYRPTFGAGIFLSILSGFLEGETDGDGLEFPSFFEFTEGSRGA